MDKTLKYFVAVALLGLISLFVIQVKWMQKSRSLVEEQFDQKVNMALCMAINEMSNDPDQKEIQKCCAIDSSDEGCCSDDIVTFLEKERNCEALDEAMNFYNIDLPYEVDVVNTPTAKLGGSYSCSLTPLTAQDDHALDIRFQSKDEYVFQDMWVMFASSLCILLLISGIVIYAIYSLRKQKILRQKNKEFFNHMAHEFKTPLTNITLANQLLSKKYDDDLLNIIANENKHLSNQVDNVLALATIEDSCYRLDREKLKVGDLLNSVVAQMKLRIEESEGKVHITDRSNDAFLWADRFHLSNTIKNIIDNALKYSSQNPQIAIHINQHDNLIVIGVTDNGLGISSEEKEQLFDKFYRGRQGMKTKGFGLGLSYAQKVMDLHEGVIEVNSDEETGTTFELQLPKAS